MRTPLWFLLFFCTSATALANEPNPHWLEIKSPHFIVLTDSSEKQGRRVAGQFEQMRSFFHSVVPTSAAESGGSIIVFALKDRKGFQSLEPSAYLAKGQLDLAGLFLGTQDKDYILLRLDAQGEHPFSTVYHEYTHYLLKSEVALPLWLNEGLAEFYQNTDIRDKDVLLGQPSPDDIYYLRDNRLLPVATLFQVDYSSPYYHEEQKGSVFYAESWALVHYFEINDRQTSQHRVRDYVQLLSQGQDALTAAKTAFGDLNRLQKTLDDYIRQGSFSEFKMVVSLTVDSASFQVRPVANSEADAIRADILIANQRNKEAEALLVSSLRDDPSSALAHEAMGTLKFSAGDTPAAAKWFGEAIQLDSKSYLAHFYFAVMSMDNGGRDHDAAIESSLRTAIALNPAFAPSYDALAMFYAARDEKLDEAHILNIRAVLLEPSNLNFRLNAASILAQQRLNAGAIGILKAALPVAKTPDQIATVQRRIEQLQQFQASLDRATGQTQPAQSSVLQASSAHTSSPAATNASLSSPKKTMVFRRVDGRVVGMAEDAPDYPTEAASGPKHTVHGILRDIRCSAPNVLSLRIDQAGKTLTLYNNNYLHIVFTTANYEPEGEIKPCTGIEDMKASVKYAEVSDKAVAGQILAIELSK